MPTTLEALQADAETRYRSLVETAATGGKLPSTPDVAVAVSCVGKTLADFSADVDRFQKREAARQQIAKAAALDDDRAALDDEYAVAYEKAEEAERAEHERHAARLKAIRGPIVEMDEKRKRMGREARRLNEEGKSVLAATADPAKVAAVARRVESLQGERVRIEMQIHHTNLAMPTLRERPTQAEADEYAAMLAERAETLAGRQERIAAINAEIARLESTKHDD